MTPLDKANAYTGAWNSAEPARLARHFTPTARLVINRGDPQTGSAAIEQMAAAVHADLPDFTLTCDGMRCNGSHAVYLWTLAGHHAGTGNPVSLSGWEEWDLDADMRITEARRWFDAGDLQAQIDGRV